MLDEARKMLNVVIQKDLVDELYEFYTTEFDDDDSELESFFLKSVRLEKCPIAQVFLKVGVDVNAQDKPA